MNNVVLRLPFSFASGKTCIYLIKLEMSGLDSPCAFVIGIHMCVYIFKMCVHCGTFPVSSTLEHALY